MNPAERARPDATLRQAAALNLSAPPYAPSAKMAGGLGFEPRLAESESAVLPLDDPPRTLPLGVLRPPAGLATSDFLALDLAGIARDKACRAQGSAQRLVVLHERTSNAMTDGTGLTGNAATAHLHGDIELTHELHHFERLAHDHATGL